VNFGSGWPSMTCLPSNPSFIPWLRTLNLLTNQLNKLAESIAKEIQLTRISLLNHENKLATRAINTPAILVPFDVLLRVVVLVVVVVDVNVGVTTRALAERKSPLESHCCPEAYPNATTSQATPPFPQTSNGAKPPVGVGHAVGMLVVVQVGVAVTKIVKEEKSSV
jgi:hypothetical protein